MNERVTIEQMICEDSCTAAYSHRSMSSWHGSMLRQAMPAEMAMNSAAC